MRTLVDRVEAVIAERGLLRPGQPVLVAVSGGVDSMVLLDLLHRLAGMHSWQLHVAHLNHQLRGRNSDADEHLVVREARRLKLPVTVERALVRSVARARGLSVEMAAREVRHDFLARTARRLGIRTVALAHHADDQLELFFLRLFRGSGTDGLGGMRWRRPSPSDRETELIRPLLEVGKAELRAWAKAHRVRFREDASNASVDIQRNRIRRELLPLLRRRFQPALDCTVSRLMELAREDSECLNEFAARFLASDRKPFRKLPISLQRRCIQIQLLEGKIPPAFDLVERLRLSPGQAVTIDPRRTILLTDRGRVRIEARGEPAGKDRVVTETTLRIKLDQASGRLVFGGLECRWRIGTGNGRVPSRKGRGRECFDADAVGSDIVLRHWRAGDRMRPIGMSRAVKLQDIFTNLKIPREERHKRVVLTTRRNEVIWVQGLRISERFKLSKATNRRLQWQWKPL